MRLPLVFSLLVGILILSGCGNPSRPVSAPAGPAVPLETPIFTTKVVEMATESAPETATPAAAAEASQPATPSEPANTGQQAITSENASALKSTALTLPEWTDFFLWPGNGQLYALAPGSKVIFPVDPQTGQLGETIQLDLPGFLLAVQPDLSRVVMQNEQSMIAVYAVAPNGSTKLVRDFGLPASGASFTSDGMTMAVPGEGEPSVTLYDVQSGAMITQLTGFETPGPVFTAVVTPDGNAVVWRSRNTVQVQQVASGKLFPLIKTDGFISDIVISPDSTRLGVLAGDQLLIYSLTGGQQIANFGLSQSAASLTFSPDGSLAAAGYLTEIQLWDIDNKVPLEPVTGHSIPVAKVGFSPDGQYLISLDQNLEMRVWQVK